MPILALPMNFNVPPIPGRLQDEQQSESSKNRIKNITWINIIKLWFIFLSDVGIRQSSWLLYFGDVAVVWEVKHTAHLVLFCFPCKGTISSKENSLLLLIYLHKGGNVIFLFFSDMMPFGFWFLFFWIDMRVKIFNEKKIDIGLQRSQRFFHDLTQ